jgi:hypothetical protein
VTTGEAERGEFLSGIDRTDAAGETLIANVAADRRLLICAEKDSYERHCVEQFVIGETRDRKETLALHRLAHHGKLIAPLPVAGASLDFVAADGRELESVLVKDDGSFDFVADHRAPEYAVVTGGGLPMFVAALPSDPQDLLEITMPSAPVQSIRVSIGQKSIRRNALIGIVVGGRYIPADALFTHQSAHGQQADLHGKGPLLIPSIVASGPIDVILGPEPREYPTGVAFGVDIFTVRQYRQQFPVKRVDASGSVVFE